jgi:AcrR family transcriptional regulator
MPDYKLRKLPRQARSRMTFDAILEACARILREGGLEAATTGAIAERAGVGIGSLYEFFPNREAVIAALAVQRLGTLAQTVAATLERTRALDDAAAVRLLIEQLLDAVAADRNLYRVLLREAPMLRDLPETRRAMAVFFELGRIGAEHASARIDLPQPAADAWLIGRMVANALLEIAFLDRKGPSRDVLVAELARMTFRMLRAHDIDATPRRRPAARRTA